MQYYAWRFAHIVFPRLPLPWSYAGARLCGRGAFAFWARGRRATIWNFRHVLPGAPLEEVRRVARRSLENYCCYLVDFMRLPSLSAETIMAACDTDDAVACLASACAGGRGAIVSPVHFGNWDAGACAVALRGNPMTVVAETFPDPRLNRMVVGARERHGLRVLPLEKGGLPIMRGLRRRETVALFIDRPKPGEGVTVSFFGHPVDVPAGPAHLALRTGAALIPCGAPRLQTGRFAFRVLADCGLTVAPTDDHDADVVQLTQLLMAAHERYIRCYPDQWYMFREMWPRKDNERPS